MKILLLFRPNEKYYRFLFKMFYVFLKYLTIFSFLRKILKVSNNYNDFKELNL